MIINKLQVELNYENIISDFDFCCLEFNYKKDTKANNEFKSEYDYGDETKEEIHALAVFHTNTHKHIYLFNKGKYSAADMDAYVKNHPYVENPSFILRKDFLDTAFREKLFYKEDRALIQLLINSLSGDDSDSYGFNNTSGKLYYPVDTKDSFYSPDSYYLSFVELAIASEMYLNFDLRTYRKDNAGKYVIDDYLRFRRALPGDEKLPHYSFGAKKDKHMHADFVDFTMFEKMQNTKAYVLAKFVIEVRKRLSNYLTIQFEEIPQNSFTKKSLESLCPYYDKTSSLPMFYETSLRKKGVSIVNWNNDNGSDVKAIIESLKTLFTKKYPSVEIEESTSINQDHFNIVIAHNENFYKTNKIQDPHQEIHRQNPYAQMITAEDYKAEIIVKTKTGETTTPYFDKIINELLIKNDISNEQLSTVFMPVSKTWHFFNVHHHYDKETKRTVFDTLSECILDKNANMKFNLYIPNRLCEYSDEVQRVILYVQELLDRESSGIIHYDEAIDGIMYSDINNIHTIIQTNSKALPDFETMVGDVKKTDLEALVNIQAIRNCIKELLITEITYKDEYMKIIKKLNCLEDEIKFKELKEAGIFYLGKGKVSKEKDWLAKLIDKIYEKTGIVVSKEIKAARHDERYELTNITDIQYFTSTRAVYNSDREESERIPCISYISGRHKSSLDQSLPTSCVIRSVISEKPLENEFTEKELLKMLAVDFVRNEHFFTVRPFTFKYLDEYEKIKKYL